MSLDRKFLETQMIYENKISDLEEQLAEKDKIIENLQTTYQSVMQTCGNDAKEIEKLRGKLSLTEKALELACENLEDINFKLYNTEMDFIEYFKAKAKEMMKSE